MDMGELAFCTKVRLFVEPAVLCYLSNFILRFCRMGEKLPIVVVDDHDDDVVHSCLLIAQAGIFKWT